MLNTILKQIFILSALLYFGACYKYSYNYKLVSGTLPQTHGTPLQTPLAGRPGKQFCCKGPYCWEITPLFNYDISAMVFGVSHRPAHNIHDVATDAGLLWGNNSANELYKNADLRVTADGLTGGLRCGSKFSPKETGFTRIISCDPAAFSKAKSIRPGDQIRLRGWIANTKISKEPAETDPSKIITMNTSSSGGLLYVRSAADIEILKKGPLVWLWAKWAGVIGMVLSLALLAALWQREVKKELADVSKVNF